LINREDFAKSNKAAVAKILRQGQRRGVLDDAPEKGEINPKLLSMTFLRG
jgi:hypothetical protein